MATLVAYSSLFKLQAFLMLHLISDLHNPCLKSEGDKLLGRELMAVSSFVPKDRCSCSLGKHKSPDRTDNGLTDRLENSLYTHTDLNKNKSSYDNLSQSVFKSQVPCRSLLVCWHKTLPSKGSETFKETRLWSEQPPASRRRSQPVHSFSTWTSHLIPFCFASSW